MPRQLPKEFIEKNNLASQIAKDVGIGMRYFSGVYLYINVLKQIARKELGENPTNELINNKIWEIYKSESKILGKGEISNIIKHYYDLKISECVQKIEQPNMISEDTNVN